MDKKYSLTAIAVATMAVGASGSALAKKPGNPGPDPAFPTVKELACVAGCAYPFWDTELAPWQEQPGVCDIRAEYFAVAEWMDTIGEGMAEGAQYAGGLEVEVVFEAYCGFDWQGEYTAEGEYIEGYCAEFPAECYFDGEGLVAARQFDYELDLSAAEMFCAEGYCSAMWDAEGLDGEGFYGAWSAAHQMACEDEGGTTMSSGQYCAEFDGEGGCDVWGSYEVPFDHPDGEGMMMGPRPGYEDFEVSLKHIAPGNGSGRQDHPVVTADCYDLSLFPYLENPD
jgi:hypothetical protein